MNYSNYKKIILDAAKDPRWQGRVDSANFTAELTNFSCQDSILITAQISDTGKIMQISYESQGCLLSQGSCALLLSYADGKLIQDIAKITEPELLNIIPADNFNARKDCFSLALNAIKSTVAKLG